MSFSLITVTLNSVVFSLLFLLLSKSVCDLCRNFPVEQYKDDRLRLVLAFWGLGIHLGRPLISQTDYKEDGSLFGSVLNHVTEGRWTVGG